MITFKIDINPVCQARHRGAKFGGMYDPSVKDKKLFIELCNGYVPSEVLTGALMVRFLFTFKRPKSHYRTGRFVGHQKLDAPVWHTGRKDIDNLCKLYLDAMNGVFYGDDGQVVELAASKAWGDVGSVFVQIEELGDD